MRISMAMLIGLGASIMGCAQERVTESARDTTASASAGEAWRDYEVYQPAITKHVVIDATTHEHKYNHCTTIAWFQDRWICMWGSHTKPDEHTPGQRMVISVSMDGKEWSPIERCFTDTEMSENPVDYPEDLGHQWQPNFGLVDGELWCLWNQGGAVRERNGVYFSRLRKSDGQWINRQLTWDGDANCEVNGERWFPSATQNLVQLRSGRVLAPVTLRQMGGGRATDAPEGAEGWWAGEKINTVLYTDDGGETWQVSPGTQVPGYSWIQWEPTVWEGPDRTVYMVARSNIHWQHGHPRIPSHQYLNGAVSHDSGETWEPSQFIPIETVCSRMHAFAADGRGLWDSAVEGPDFDGNRRYVMIHHDSPGAELTWAPARRNIAFFFQRGGGFDFAAGTTITDFEPEVAYPQAWAHDGVMLISYTQGNSAPRSIHVARVESMPKPDTFYIMPRLRAVVESARPDQSGDRLVFRGSQHMTTRDAVEPGEEGFSFGAWVLVHNSGTLLDTRHTSGTQRGFVIMLAGSDSKGESQRGISYLHAGLLTQPHVVVADLPVDRRTGWHYVGLTVDNRSGEATFYVDGESATATFDAPAPIGASGDVAVIGAKSLEGSSVLPFQGAMRTMSLYPGAALGPEHHRWLFNQHAQAMGGEPANDAGAKPAVEPLFVLDPAAPDNLERDFVLPDDAMAGDVTVAEEGGRRLLRMPDQASAGVELDHNQRADGDIVSLRFRAKISADEPVTLCTVGDAIAPARLVFKDDGLQLTLGDESMALAEVNLDEWFDVELTTGAGKTQVAIGHAEAELDHVAEATWLYLGEGFPSQPYETGALFWIDAGAVRTRVTPGAN